MLRSLNSSSSHDQEDDDELDRHQELPMAFHFLPKIARPPAPPPVQGLPCSLKGGPSTSLPSSVHLKQLLVRCAEFIAISDFATAHQILSILSSNSSPRGDSTERLAYYFAKALSFHIDLPPRYHPASDDQEDDTVRQACYLSLNQVTPFIRFSHLTANQAILDAIERVTSQPSPIHIIDFNIMHGVQWPPFMQALADRYNSSSPSLRISATGKDLTTLHRTGERLAKFAQSLGLMFQFEPLVLPNDDPNSLSLFFPTSIRTFPDEVLAVNCVLYLHRLVREEDQDGADLKMFLSGVKTLGPKIVTIAEREANHNHPVFMLRFMEALDHFSALFDSLEATLPSNSGERLEVERVFLGKEIVDILGTNEFLRRKRTERHQRFGHWEGLMRGAGFNNVPLSPFALSQAKLLLRLHYPADGYYLDVLNDSFFLGWHNRALFSVSSWQ